MHGQQTADDYLDFVVVCVTFLICITNPKKRILVFISVKNRKRTRNQRTGFYANYSGYFGKLRTSFRKDDNPGKLLLVMAMISLLYVKSMPANRKIFDMFLTRQLSHLSVMCSYNLDYSKII